MTRLRRPFPALLGFSVWSIFLLCTSPYSIFEITHVQVLLLAAPLWLIPLSWHIGRQSSVLVWLGVACGLLFAGSYVIVPGGTAAMMTVPWLILAVVQGVKKIVATKNFDIPTLTELAAYLYLPVGIAWALIDRMGITVMGYSPIIVLLTAIHFHYAGFLLPQLTSWLLKSKQTIFSKVLGIGVIAGVPLVALGISASQFQWPSSIEIISVSILTITSSLIGIQFICYGWSIKNEIARFFFTLGGIALVVGMSLAFCYGWRSIFVIDFLTIPWMYAVHGTFNAIGFAAPILLGYYFVGKEGR